MELSLFKISTEIADLLEKLTETIGEVNEDQEQMLDQLSTALRAKTDNIVEYNAFLDSTLDVLSKRIGELKEIETRVKTKQEKYHNYVLSCMDKLQETKITGDIHAVSVRKPSQIVEITDENDIPIEFLKIKTTTAIDKTAIKDKLKAGAQIPGATLSLGKRSVTFK